MTEDAEEAIRLGEAIQAVNTSPAHRVIALDEGALSNAARLADLYGLPTDQVLLEAMLLGMRTLSDAAEVARRGRVAQAGRAEADYREKVRIGRARRAARGRGGRERCRTRSMSGGWRSLTS